MLLVKGRASSKIGNSNRTANTRTRDSQKAALRGAH